MLFPVLIMLVSQQIYFSHAEIYVFRYDSNFYFVEFNDVPATFGPNLSDCSVKGMLMKAEPADACDETLDYAPPLVEDVGVSKFILIVARYSQARNCSFEQKVRMAQLKGYDGVIVHNVGSNDLVPMSAKNSTGILIPSVFVSESSGLLLKNIYTDPKFYVVVTGETPFNIQTHLLIPFAIAVLMCFFVMVIFMIVKYIKDRRRQRRYRLPKSQLNKIPTCKFQKGDRYETCCVCLEDYVEGEKLRVLPCNHVYHMKCIDPWLTNNKRVCPICKRKVFAHDEPHPDSDSDSDTDDRTPLIRTGPQPTTEGGTFRVQNENPLRRAARSISQVLDGHYFVTSSDNYSINAERQEQDRPNVETSTSSASTDTTNSSSIPEVVFVHSGADNHRQPTTTTTTEESDTSSSTYEDAAHNADTGHNSDHHGEVIV